MKFIKYFDNYADEFDIEGFRIMSNEMWEDWLKNAKKAFSDADELDEPVYYYFGSNEAVEYEDGFAGFLNSFQIQDVSLARAAHIENCFYSNRMGFFPEF